MKKTLFWLAIWAAALLLLLFVVFCVKDTIYYSAAMNSAPLRVFYLVRAIEFALPAAICGGAAWILKKKT
ncbi:MAG: hypothetical protein E7446_03515 [Ruminococcaceae bacterium]|nr:hypothetical protein [Oscillospiraceae bacterium]